MNVAVMSLAPFSFMRVQRSKPRYSLVQSQTSVRSHALDAALTATQPNWMGELYRRFAEVSLLQPGWDGHRGKPISHDTIAFARKILESIARPGMPAPHLAPLSYGGVQLEWHAKGIDLELEIVAPYQISVLFEDSRTGEEWERNIDGADLSEIGEPLSQLSTR